MTTIAIDYDGTIGDTNREKVKWIRAHLGKEVSPWECNATDCIPLIGRDAYRLMGDEVYERAGTLRTEPVPGVAKALRLLSATATLYVVTARLHSRLASVREWLDSRGLLACFQDVRTSVGTTKLAVCQEIGADILIDDDPRHLPGTESKPPDCILLQAGRGESRECAPGVAFCGSWEEAIRLIAQRQLR